MSQSLLPSSLQNLLGVRQAESLSESASVDGRSRTGFFLSVGFILLAVLGPFIASLTSEGAAEGSSFRQISYSVVLVAVFILAAPWRRGWRMIAMPLPMLVALGWCWISVIWAIEPGISFRRLLLTTIVIWTVFIIAHSQGYRKTADALRVALTLTLVLNYLTVWIVPDVGIHLGIDSWLVTALAGNWRGIMTHKNFAGAACAITILLFLFDAKHINARIRGAVLLAAGYFLYRSASKTSMGMVVLSAAIGYGYSMLNRKLRIFLIPGAIIAICAIATFMTAYHDAISRLYMAPTAFTGRGQIWATLLLFLKDHPLGGSGFESFWNVGDGGPIYIYGHGYVTTITVGHNGYLDLLVTVGIPGMIMIVWAVMLWPLIQIVSSERISVEKGSLLCAMVLFCMGHNVTESSLFERDALTGVFAIFVAAFTYYSLPKNRKSGKSNAARHRAGSAVMAEMAARHGS